MEIVYDGITFAVPSAVTLYKRLRDAKKITAADVGAGQPVTREETEELAAKAYGQKYRLLPCYEMKNWYQDKVWELKACFRYGKRA